MRPIPSVRAPRRLRSAPITLSLLLSLAGCSKDAPPGKVVAPGGGSAADPDAGGPGNDAGERLDGGARDAANGGSGGDAAPRADAGDSAAGEEDAGNTDPTQVCEVAAELSELSQPVSFSDEAGFVVTPGLTGFGVAFTQRNPCDVIRTLPVAALGAYKQPSELFGDCNARVTDVSLLHVSDGYRLTWVDNSTGSAELQTLVMAEALTPPAEITRTRLTENALLELRPQQANIAGHGFAAWIAQDPVKSTRAIVLRAADASGPAHELVAAADGYQPTSFALAQLGAEGGALAFVSELKQAGVWLLPLTAAGEASGEPLRLSAAVTTGNTVDLATREEDGGAVVYSIDVGGSREVRFRRLSPTGELASDEIKVVSGALQGRDASLARLGGGYVVAYRSLATSTEPEPQVRLLFVTKEGNLQRDGAGRVLTYPVASASPTGGRLTVRVSTDGQLLLGFLDASDQGARFRVIRKRLDCAF